MAHREAIEEDGQILGVLERTNTLLKQAEPNIDGKALAEGPVLRRMLFRIKKDSAHIAREVEVILRADVAVLLDHAFEQLHAVEYLMVCFVCE